MAKIFIKVDKDQYASLDASLIIEEEETFYKVDDPERTISREIFQTPVYFDIHKGRLVIKLKPGEEFEKLFFLASQCMFEFTDEGLSYRQW